MHNIISNLNANSKIPPSELGFVCKPELPPHINILFRARPPLPFLKKKIKSISRSYSGVFDNGNCSNILDLFEKDNNNNKLIIEESKYIKKLKNIIIKNENNKQLNKERIKKWNPKNNSNATGDPYKTLFVYRLDKNADEKTLKKDFEQNYGRIKKVRIVKDNKGNNRGYAFLEFAHSSDLKAVLKDKKNHHIKLNGKSVYCDYERGRTDKHFIPRKFGGDLGNARDFPIWLEEQLNDIKKKYPELTKIKKRKVAESEMEKGEILDDEDIDNNIDNNENIKNIDKNDNKNDINNNKNEDNNNNIKKNDSNNINNDNKDNNNNNNKNEKKDNNDDKMEIEKGEII